MQIRLVPLEQLRQDVEQMERQRFVDTYPGTFLLALGYVAVEELRHRFRPGATGQKDQALTTAMSFGIQRRHQATPSHPLAGLAFLVQPAGAPGPVTIGRSPECSITVPDESVSNLHCQLEVQPDGVYVVDIGSTNGTSVNLEQLAAGMPHLLADEDTISVGRYSFQMLSARTLHDTLTLVQAADTFDGLDLDA